MDNPLFQFSLRTLFIVMTTIYVGLGPTSRIVHFRHRAAYHHRQVEQQIKTANRVKVTYPAWRSERVLKLAHHHLILATAYDYASFHPWLSVADAQVITNPQYAPCRNVLEEK